jgi:alkaline phosphatase D
MKSFMTISLSLGFLSCGLTGVCQTQKTPQTAATDTIPTAYESSARPNNASEQSRPYVVLLLLDGFRYDYAELHNARNIQQMARDGASAPNGMVPSYPSISIPNYYALVSGLYPDHHGLIDNAFYDPARKTSWDATDLAKRNDASWYRGTPLWVAAEKAGLRTGCIAWVGCEAKIQGVLPSLIVPYVANDKNISDQQKIDQLIGWLALPPQTRPHLLLAWLSDTDHAGHQFGPDSAQLAAAVITVDALVGRLRAGIAKTGLPVNLIVLSDHGMAKIQGPWVDLDRYTDLNDVVTDGPRIYPPNEESAAKIYSRLKDADSRFKLYRRNELPKGLHYGTDQREGDPIIVANGPYLIRARRDSADADQHPAMMGTHGFDPAQVPQMYASFYAVGPAIRQGLKIKLFPNVDVFPTVLKLLELPPVSSDGSAISLSGGTK